MYADIKLPKKPKGHKEKSKPKDRLIHKVTFFGDSAIPEDDEIYKSVYNAAKELAKQGYSIVNGGGPGLMKAATDGAESVDGDTVAIYWQPKLASFFEGKNLANVADESDSQSNYVNRTFGLIEKGDAYVVCKGGTGTVSEFGLVWALAKLYYGAHKPVILYGSFWKELIESFQKTMYIDEKELSVLYYAETPEDIIETLKNHELRLDRSKVKLVKGDEAAFLLRPNTKTTIESYNEVARKYHTEHAGKLVAQEQLDEFISMVNPPAQVLDVGTGPGLDAKYLSKHYSVTGVEPSQKFCEIARYENPNADILFGDIVDIDLNKQLFKGVWARDSLHHIKEEDLDGVFQKLTDSLVQDGILYVIVREGKGEATEKKSRQYGDFEVFYHYFTAGELTKRAERAGLEVVKIDHTQRSHKWLVGVFKKK